MFCTGDTAAKKRYERDVMRAMVAYVVVMLVCSWFVKHGVGGGLFLYVWSVLPALPILGMMARMGRYLQEEKDEYLRLLAMKSILVGTAALLGTMVVNDFVRVFAHMDALPPFAGFVIFCVGMGITQLVQRLQNRVPDDE